MERKPLLVVLSVLVALVMLLAGAIVYEIQFKGAPQGADYAPTLVEVERNPDGTLTMKVRCSRNGSGTFGGVSVSNVRVYQKVERDAKMAKVWRGTASLNTKPPGEPAPQTLELTFTGGPYPDEWKEFHLLFGLDYTVKSGLLGLVGQVHDFTEEHSVDVAVPAR